jgi:hypothetical protein
MTGKQADMMLAYLDVIAMQTAVIAAQSQRVNPLLANEVDLIREATSHSVRRVYEDLRRPSTG